MQEIKSNISNLILDYKVDNRLLEEMIEEHREYLEEKATLKHAVKKVINKARYFLNPKYRNKIKSFRLQMIKRGIDGRVRDVKKAKDKIARRVWNSMTPEEKEHLKFVDKRNEVIKKVDGGGKKEKHREKPEKGERIKKNQPYKREKYKYGDHDFED